MNVIIVILLTLFVVSFIILVVYIVITLFQIKKTFQEAQELLKKINKNLDNMILTTEKLKNIISLSPIPLIFYLGSVITTGLAKFLSSISGRRG